MAESPTLDDVYRKFGEASEAAQLLEMELGTLLLWNQCLQESADGKRAAEILKGINRQTLGSLMKNAKCVNLGLDEMETLLNNALRERNRLSHSFYRQHNLRRNSGEGCAVMMRDLEDIHHCLLDAYKTLMLLSDEDLEELVKSPFALPTGNVPI
jgi:hypothetical protein